MERPEGWPPYINQYRSPVYISPLQLGVLAGRAVERSGLFDWAILDGIRLAKRLPLRHPLNVRSSGLDSEVGLSPAGIGAPIWVPFRRHLPFCLRRESSRFRG